MTVSALKLAPRTQTLPPQAERGRMLNADEVASIVYEGRVSAKWVRIHTRALGFKLGGEWLWYESEATAERDRRIAAQRVAR